MFWNKVKESPPPVGNVRLLPPDDEDVAIVGIWESLQRIRSTLQGLIDDAGPNVRRYAIFMTILERAMGYYYLFIFKGWDNAE